MPTVLRIVGCRVVIYPNDHRPAHVHIIGNGSEVVFNLHCPMGPPELRENYGFSENDLARIVAALISDLATACLQWEKIHGNY